MTYPLRDAALGVEVGPEVQQALMTREDWEEAVDRLLAEPHHGSPSDPLDNAPHRQDGSR